MPDPKVKEYLYKEGIARAGAFLLLNQIIIPEFRNRHLNGNTGLCEYNRGNSRVSVDLPVTAWPVIKPCHMRWSHPGWKTDRTAYGVVCHEVGHHIEFILGTRRKFNHNLWKLALQANKKKVTSYEPNHHEAFAESMRLYIGNPDLLRLGIPERYNFITEILGLTHSETRDYKTVLGNENYFNAADKWCNNG